MQIGWKKSQWSWFWNQEKKLNRVEKASSTEPGMGEEGGRLSFGFQGFFFFSFFLIRGLRWGFRVEDDVWELGEGSLVTKFQKYPST